MMFEFTLYPNSEFDFDLLPTFSRGHGVEFRSSFNEDAMITFSSDNLNYLDDVRDTLSFLNMSEVIEVK